MTELLTGNNRMVWFVFRIRVGRSMPDFVNGIFYTNFISHETKKKKKKQEHIRTWWLDPKICAVSCVVLEMSWLIIAARRGPILPRGSRSQSVSIAGGPHNMPFSFKPRGRHDETKQEAPRTPAHACPIKSKRSGGSCAAAACLVSCSDVDETLIILCCRNYWAPISDKISNVYIIQALFLFNNYGGNNEINPK